MGITYTVNSPEYKDKVFAIYSTNIKDIVGACSYEGISDVLYEDEDSWFIELFENEFNSDEFFEDKPLEKIKGRPFFKPKFNNIVELIKNDNK